MNIGINFDHQLNTSQQLNLAPQLLQWLRLLHLPTTELASIVQTELEKNPALEVDDSREDAHDTAVDDAIAPENTDAEPVDTAAADAIATAEQEKYDFLADIDEQWKNDSVYAPGQNHADSDEEDRHKYILDSISSAPSLHEYLLRQLPHNEMAEEELRTAELIIGSIDEKGYLSLPVAEIAAATGTDTYRVEKVLAVVQTFDPAGIAARDLRECLLLQIHDMDETFLPRRIVRDHLDALGRKQHAEIAQALNVSGDEVLEAQRFITSLNPAPGSKFSDNPAEYLNPDVIVHEIEGIFVAELNDSHIPHLRISSSCKQLIDKPALKADEASYLRNKIRSATFLIQGIRQRQATLQKVADQITSFQQEYLANPKGDMKPLTMAKIAAIIGVHETTVSRAIANKHIMTPRGLFEMKHFFRAGYRCSDGSAKTPDSVKDLIAELIEKENPVTPLKDITIARLLEKRSGLRMARRTIAKYREEMDIPSSKERRRQMLASSSKRAKDAQASKDNARGITPAINNGAKQKDIPTVETFPSENMQSAVA